MVAFLGFNFKARIIIEKVYFLISQFECYKLKAGNILVAVEFSTQFPVSLSAPRPRRAKGSTQQGFTQGGSASRSDLQPLCITFGTI